MHDSRRVFLLSLGALAACGGGSDSAPAPAPAPVPEPPPPPAQRLMRLFRDDTGRSAPLWGQTASGALWKSADGGSTWTSVPGPTVDKVLSVLSAGPDTLWLTGLEGQTPVLWRGTTAGTSWVKRTLPPDVRTPFQISSDDGNSMAVSWVWSFGGMTSFYERYQSSDAGLTWVTAAYGFSEALSVGASWRFAKVLRGTNFGALPYGPVQRSLDSGITWQTRLALDDSRAGALLGSPDPAVLLVASYAHGGSYAVPVAPVDWRLHQTQDGGNTWAEWDAPAAVRDFTNIWGAASQGLLLASRSSDSQTLRSKDFGRTWQPLVLPAATQSFNLLAQGALWARSDTSAQVSLDLGDTWTAATVPPGTGGSSASIRQTGATRLVAELPDAAGVSISQDLGKTWQDVMVR